uniref:LLM class F420-dependent oxidoreductase n=1 Tax=Thermorudis peleae TaxID=1382356 RepID=A0A831TAU0_9BACT
MAPARQLSFGIKTSPQQTTDADILRVWQEADANPAVEHAWVFDHFIPLGPDPTGPCLEGWSLLAALAARTERLRIGVMVTGNTYRHPAVLANIAATVDVISGGRLDFGIGAGWHELEHDMYGLELPSPGRRIRMLGEACEVIRRLWTEERPSFEGRYYRLREARCEPKPVQKPYPPFVIGGSGEQLTLRVAAQYADIWNFGGGPVETFRHKSEVLDRHCLEIGRDPSSIQRSVQLWVDDADPAATRELARQYIDAGATHLVLILRPPFPEGVTHRLADEVIGPLRAAYQPGV